MGFIDEWLKKQVKGEINDLLKADGISTTDGESAPSSSVSRGNYTADQLPETVENHDASTQIGRKAIIDDPYFENLTSQVNIKHKMSRLTNRTLKEISIRDWMVSTIIQTRVDTLLRFSRPEHRRFEMGFRVVKKDRNAEYSKDELAEVAAIEDFIYHCGRKEGTPADERMLFGEFLKLTVRDALTFGHVAVEKVKTRAGGLHRFRPLPAESVYLINKKLSKEQIKQEEKQARQTFNKPFSDNDPKNDQQVNESDIDYYKYVQMSYNNQALAHFGDEDMIFKLFNPQNFVDSNGYCYVPKTAYVALADGSTKLVEDIGIGDKVITHTGEIKEVYELKERDFSGNIIKISPYGLMDQHLSPEHPLYILSKKNRRQWEHNPSSTPSMSWVPAQEIKKGDYLSIPKLHFKESFTTIDLSEYGDLRNDGLVQASLKQNCPQHRVQRLIPLDEQLAFILGLYAGDGTRTGSSLRFDLGFNEQYIADKIHNYFNNLGIKTTQNTTTCLQVFVGSKVFVNLFSDLVPGNTWSKKLNNKLFNMSKKARASMLVGYVHADGTVDDTGDVTANSVSYTLVNNFATLLNSLGFLSKIKQYGKEGTVKKILRNKEVDFHKSDSYRLQIPGGALLTLGFKEIKNKKVRNNSKFYYRDTKDYFLVSVARINSYMYSGKVHNFEVRDNHSYIANQVVSHNCYSPLELSIINVTNHLNVENYNANFFTHGYAARGVLHLKGTVTQAQLMNFRRQFYNSISGQQHAWRTPIVAGLDDVQWVPMSGSAKEMEYINFNNHLMRIIAAMFQIDPVELGLEYLASANGRAPMQQANNEYKIAYSRERGLYPILMFIEDMINSDLVPALDKGLSDKYKFVFTGYTDETPQSEIAQMQAEMSVWKSMNDLLVQSQKEKINTPAADLPLNQAFWALVEKNYTRGEIRETFFGDKGAAERRELAYIPGDSAYMAWQQTILALDQAKEQKAAQEGQAGSQAEQQQMEMKLKEQEHQHNEAKHSREEEKHGMEMEQLKAQAASEAVSQGNPLQTTANQFGTSKSSSVDGKSIANPINKLDD